MVKSHSYDYIKINRLARKTDNPLSVLPWELLWIIDKISMTKGNILEIGTYSGTTASEMALAYPDRRVICIDCNLPEYGRADESVCAYAKHLPNVELIWIDSEFYDYEDGIAFIFIDGDHTWNGVKIDTEKALNYLRRRHGTIVWHDYSEDFEVFPYLNWLEDIQHLGIRHVQGTTLAFYDC